MALPSSGIHESEGNDDDDVTLEGASVPIVPVPPIEISIHGSV